MHLGLRGERGEGVGDGGVKAGDDRARLGGGERARGAGRVYAGAEEGLGRLDVANAGDHGRIHQGNLHGAGGPGKGRVEGGRGEAVAQGVGAEVLELLQGGEGGRGGDEEAAEHAGVVVMENGAVVEVEARAAMARGGSAGGAAEPAAAHAKVGEQAGVGVEGEKEGLASSVDALEGAVAEGAGEGFRGAAAEDAGAGAFGGDDPVAFEPGPEGPRGMLDLG